MKKLLLIAFLLVPPGLFAQQDSLMAVDTLINPKDTLPPPDWHLQGGGLWFSDGNIQHFDGYNYRLLYANARFGLPLLPDWEYYSPLTVAPQYWEAGGSIWLGEKARKLRARFSLGLSHRRDSMLYTSAFAVNDTIYGRTASEESWFLSLGATGIKHTRRLAGLFYLYGGAEIWAGFSPGSNIRFIMYEFDYGDNRILGLDEFLVSGKARLNLYIHALVGLEAILGNRLGLMAELRSGVGAHIVVRERLAGLSRTAFLGGLNYYFRAP